MERNSSKSLLMLTLSMIIFGSIGIFRRYIPWPSSALACFRGLSGAIFLFMIAKLQKKQINHPIGNQKILWLIITGAMMGANWLLLFEAYNYTTIATATLCYYMQPSIVILLSPILFGEKISARKWVCIVLSIIGMALVSGIIENGIPASSESKGVLFGIGAAAFYSAVIIMNKKLPGVDAYQKTIIQLLSAAVLLIPYMLIRKQSIAAEWTATMVVMLLIVGFIHTGAAYALYFGSMDGVQTQTVAIFSYLDPVMALLLSSIILHEKMTVYGIIGAILIIGAALVSEMKTARK